MASSSLIQNVVPFFEIRIPVHVEWYDDIRVVKSVPTTSTFSDFCAYFREIKNISKLVALMNGLHVVDFRGRTSLRNFVTIENASNQLL